MGNIETKHIQQENELSYKTNYKVLNSDSIVNVKNKYKIIEINWFDPIQVSSTLFEDEYFKLNPHKIKVLEDMVDHLYTHTNNSIGVNKTNYICNEKECLCIANKNNFNIIYDKKK